MDTHYVEKEEDHTSSGYTERIRTNRIGPKDGSKPLTTIAFSLTNEFRDKLQTALDGYINAHKDYPPKDDKEELAQIIRDNFPPQVLTELGTLAQKDENASTVYIVKNLPETKVPAKLLDERQEEELIEWRDTNCYARVIGIGVGQAVGLSHQASAPLMRYNSADYKNKKVAGGELHKHRNAVTVLGGVLNDGAVTRFTDIGTLLEHAEQMNPSEVPAVKARRAFDNQKTFKLNDLTAQFPDWRKPIGLELEPGNPDEKDKLAELQRIHSQDEIIGPRDLVLWPEHGRIVHQALPHQDVKAQEGMLNRLVVGQSFNYRSS